MKFIVDAHLPRKRSIFLVEQGHDSIHTLDLPNKNASSDNEINTISINEKRVVITKDSDFYDSYLIKLEPYKLLLISTGNISTKKLLLLFKNNLEKIVDEVERNFLVELTSSSMITIL